MKSKTILLTALLAILPLAACSGGSGGSSQPTSSGSEPVSSTSVNPYTYTFESIEISATNLQYIFKIKDRSTTPSKLLKTVDYYKIGDDYMKVYSDSSETYLTYYFKKAGNVYNSWKSSKSADQIANESDWEKSTDQQLNVANGSIEMLPAAASKYYKLNETRTVEVKIPVDGVSGTALSTKCFENEDTTSDLYWHEGKDFKMPVLSNDVGFSTVLTSLDHRVTEFPTSILPK